MGKTEMAADLFRITQTEDKIKNDEIRGQLGCETTAEAVGREVRETMIRLNKIAPIVTFSPLAGAAFPPARYAFMESGSSREKKAFATMLYPAGLPPLTTSSAALTALPPINSGDYPVTA